MEAPVHTMSLVRVSRPRGFSGANSRSPVLPGQDPCANDAM